MKTGQKAKPAVIKPVYTKQKTLLPLCQWASFSKRNEMKKGSQLKSKQEVALPAVVEKLKVLPKSKWAGIIYSCCQNVTCPKPKTRAIFRTDGFYKRESEWIKFMIDSSNLGLPVYSTRQTYLFGIKYKLRPSEWSGATNNCKRYFGYQSLATMGKLKGFTNHDGSHKQQPCIYRVLL